MRKWWFPWLFPVILLGAVTLVSRPAVCVVWLAACVTAGRLANGWIDHMAATRGRPPRGGRTT